MQSDASPTRLLTTSCPRWGNTAYMAASPLSSHRTRSHPGKAAATSSAAAPQRAHLMSRLPNQPLRGPQGGIASGLSSALHWHRTRYEASGTVRIFVATANRRGAEGSSGYQIGRAHV